jgi:hypothetical protein
VRVRLLCSVSVLMLVFKKIFLCSSIGEVICRFLMTINGMPDCHVKNVLFVIVVGSLVWKRVEDILDESVP